MPLPIFNIKERIEGQQRYYAYVKEDLNSRMYLPKRFELEILTYDLLLFHIKDTVTNKTYSNIDDNYNSYSIETLQEMIFEDLKWERRKERITKLLSK